MTECRLHHRKRTLRHTQRCQYARHHQPVDLQLPGQIKNTTTTIATAIDTSIKRSFLRVNLDQKVPCGAPPSVLVGNLWDWWNGFFVHPVT